MPPVCVDSRTTISSDLGLRATKIKLDELILLTKCIVSADLILFVPFFASGNSLSKQHTFMDIVTKIIWKGKAKIDVLFANLLKELFEIIDIDDEYRFRTSHTNHADISETTMQNNLPRITFD